MLSKHINSLRTMGYGSDINDILVGTFVSSLQKNDTFKINGHDYTVTSVSKKGNVRLKNELGNTVSITFLTRNGNNGVYYGTVKWDNLSRDIEGLLTLDLLNEYNPFHEPSKIYKMLVNHLDKILSENN